MQPSKVEMQSKRNEELLKQTQIVPNKCDIKTGRGGRVV